MERSQQHYRENYRELELIGRGNFGTATLVQSTHDPRQHFIAKKIDLKLLSKREQEGAQLEAQVLKDLKHPNIVSYIDSFIMEGVLVIIMEYCEEGDLSFHVKKKKEKQEYLPEQLILNWFLQLCLALKAIHDKKILHRDIKTSNIFLTSNGTVKIGDFGISKVLENTAEQAQTVVGTPYYMSPEVCESKPYTFKSDIWALGCVLYELCTLKHAFQSNSLLGLVNKIVQEKAEAIPRNYSNELQALVFKILTKSDLKRPSLKEIFNDPFIQQVMQQFITNNGYKNQQKISIKSTKTHKEVKKIYQSEHKNDNNNQNQNQANPDIKPFNQENDYDQTLQSHYEQTQVNKNNNGNNNNKSYLPEDYDKTLVSQMEQTNLEDRNQFQSKLVQQNENNNKSYLPQDYDKTIVSTMEQTQQSNQNKSYLPKDYDLTIQSNMVQTQQMGDLRNQSKNYNQNKEREILGDTVQSSIQQSLPFPMQQNSQHFKQQFQLDGNSQQQTLGMGTFDLSLTGQNQQSQTNFQMPPGLTPAQQVKLRKEMKILQEQERIKQATSQAFQQNKSRQRTQQEFLSSHQFDRKQQQEQIRKEQMEYYAQPQIQQRIAGTNRDFQQYQQFLQSQKMDSQQNINNNINNGHLDNTTFSVHQMTTRDQNGHQNQFGQTRFEDRPLDTVDYKNQNQNNQNYNQKQDKQEYLNPHLIDQFTQLASSKGFSVNKQYSEDNYSESPGKKYKEKLERMNSQENQNKNINGENNNKGPSQFANTKFQDEKQDMREVTCFEKIPVQQNLEEYNDDEDEEYNDYEDDFEDYESEDEEEEEIIDQTRLTQKADQSNLQEVIDLYKNQLENNQMSTSNSQLSEIKENQSEYKPQTPQLSKERRIFNQNQEKIQKKKQDCIREIGEQKFNDIYKYITGEREKDSSDDKIMKHLVQKYGKKNSDYIYKVEQIIFLESF